MRFLFLSLLLLRLVHAQDSLVKTIWFAPDSYELTPTLIADIASLWQNGLHMPDGKRLLVIGHTDNQKDSLSNMRLSEQRARAVADVLRKAGVPSDKIHLGVFGANEPVGNNSTLSGRAINRRVEIKIGPAVSQTRKSNVFSYSLQGTNYNQDTITIGSPQGIILRFPPGCIQPEVAALIRITLFQGEPLFSEFINQSFSSLSTADRPVDLALFLKLTNPTEVFSTRTAFELLLPASEYYSGMQWFEENDYKRSKRWSAIERKPFPLIYQGTPYTGILCTQLKSYALGKQNQKLTEPLEEIQLNMDVDVDSIFLVYQNDSIQRMYRFAPDGNFITPKHYIIKPYSSALTPVFYIYTSEEKKNKVYLIKHENLVWSKRKKAWTIRKKDLR
ncbi:MAG TPA: OmpA family protein [Flavobacteriales bacterium]|nr:OmpA family protein [Flavobacteriales bacterium]HRE98587.1 OmpA family protein [Flavobacteriales bacterium]HRJ37148.1 OmpA family protein [Flavobacteriales bacterium]